MKALAKLQADRYQTVKELQQDIEAYQGGFATTAEHAGAAKLLWLLIKRHKTVAAASLLLLVAATVFLVEVTVQRNRATVALEKFQTEQALRLEQEKTAAPALLAKARDAIQRKDFAAALESVEIAVAFNPQLTPARILRAELLMVHRRFAEAEKELGELLKLEPKDADSKRLIEICDQARRQDTEQIDAAMSEVFMRRKEYVLAESLVREADKALALYNERLGKAGWKARIVRDQDGKLSLGVGGKGLTDLTPLKGIPLNKLTADNNELVHLGPLEGMPLEELDVSRNAITDLTPLKGLPLKRLILAHTKITDLRPLKGLPLQTLNLGGCANLEDLAALKGMQLESLIISQLPVSDLTPLAGMRLTNLDIGFTRVRDLSPLRGMPLTRLSCRSGIADLSPLQGMPLQFLGLDYCTSVSDLSPLRGMPLAILGLRSTRIMDLTPLSGMPLKSLYISGTDVSDLRPLKGMPLINLSVSDCPKIRDFTLLKTLRLVNLEIGATSFSDLTLIEHMPLSWLAINNSLVSDLTPLAALTTLQALNLGYDNMQKGAEVLRAMTHIRKFNPNWGDGSFTAPAAFWNQYNEYQAALRSHVALDLSPALNADIISTAEHEATDFNAQKQSWCTKSWLRAHDSPDNGIPDYGWLLIPKSDPEGYFHVSIEPPNAILLTDKVGRQPKDVIVDLPSEQRRRYSRLAFLHGGTWADAIIAVTVTYETGPTDVLKLQILDWNPKGRTQSPAPNQTLALKSRPSNGSWRPAEMFAQTFPADPKRILKSLTFCLESCTERNADGSRTAGKFAAAIFAISALPAEREP